MAAPRSERAGVHAGLPVLALLMALSWSLPARTAAAAPPAEAARFRLTDGTVLYGEITGVEGQRVIIAHGRKIRRIDADRFDEYSCALLPADLRPSCGLTPAGKPVPADAAPPVAARSGSSTTAQAGAAAASRAPTATGVDDGGVPADWQPLIPLILAAALIALIVAKIDLVVLAFRTSGNWGMAVLVLPFGPLAFSFSHFARARRSALTFLVSAVVALVAFIWLARPGMASLGVELPWPGAPASQAASADPDPAGASPRPAPARTASTGGHGDDEEG